MARRRLRRRGIRLRWLVVALVVLAALLYYRPARTYMSTRHVLGVRSHEVDRLAAKRRRLRRLLAASRSDAALAREARRLGLVKPGEQLFIVKGIESWRRRHGYARRGG